MSVTDGGVAVRRCDSSPAGWPYPRTAKKFRAIWAFLVFSAKFWVVILVGQ